MNGAVAKVSNSPNTLTVAKFKTNVNMICLCGVNFCALYKDEREIMVNITH